MADPREENTPRIVAFIQARMGSTRLPGKVLEPIGDRSLLAWTVAGVQAIPGFSTVVVATTTEPQDDPLGDAATTLGAEVHRGPVLDVLTRCFDAVAPHAPDLGQIRQTADNPFPDPSIAASQVEALREQGLDYVGIGGLADRHRGRGLPHGVAQRGDGRSDGRRRPRARDAVPLQPPRAVPDRNGAAARAGRGRGRWVAVYR